MKDRKLTKQEIAALAAQIKADQSKPVRENERRVRIGGSFKDIIKKTSHTPPVSNKDLAKWVKKQRGDIK